ncbi:CIC11C00000001230 [Sungouiella intermedia]|uniref:CIC11C00000001230 n=1 Tax=Sungouiella intermedia TaxID=45354 RepID=A0A1L0DFI3_9ASCO|nr:CIC11C00000001230 [[Candida] intermedia]
MAYPKAHGSNANHINCSAGNNHGRQEAEVLALARMPWLEKVGDSRDDELTMRLIIRFLIEIMIEKLEWEV